RGADCSAEPDLLRALQKARNHLRRVPRNICRHAPGHAAIEKGGAVTFFLRLRPRKWIERLVGAQTRRHCRVTYLLSTGITLWGGQRRGCCEKRWGRKNAQSRGPDQNADATFAHCSLPRKAEALGSSA